MADTLLTDAEFAQSIKAKYPAYAAVPDAELAAKMLEKYPEYRDRVRTVDFRTTNEPPSTAVKAAVFGKNALQAGLDALPGAGAIVGGVLATPETLGGGTLLGAALGAGAGRGLRDLVSQGLGLERPTTAGQKTGAIALDAGETYLAGKILPALWEIIKAPGATVGDVINQTKTLYQALPKAAKFVLPDFEALAKLPKGVEKAPAAILERPAWQTWQQHLPDAQPSPPVARTTGTSMIPAAMPSPAPVAAAESTAPAIDEFTAARAAKVGNALPDQKALNDAALEVRRAAYRASQTGSQAAEPIAAAPSEPILAASGKMKLTAAEFKEFQRLVTRGMSMPDAENAVKASRELAARLGGATDAEVAKVIVHRRPRL